MIILALDSVGYDWIKKLRLKKIQQKRCELLEIGGNLIIDRHKGDPLTPVIWASFITGEPPSVHGVTSFSQWNPFIEFFKNNIFERYHMNKIGVRAGMFLRKIGFKRKTIDKSMLKCDSIFEIITNSKAISIPSYNEHPVNKDFRRDLILCLDGKVEESELVKRIEEEYQKKLDILNRSIGKYDLVMIHIFKSDLYQHLYWNRPKKIKEMYKEMDKIVRDMNKKTDETILALSDHSQEKGIHTPHAFWSINEDVDWNIRTITDFKDNLVKVLT